MGEGKLDGLKFYELRFTLLNTSIYLQKINDFQAKTAGL